jgi:hypothetical protein
VDENGKATICNMSFHFQSTAEMSCGIAVSKITTIPRFNSFCRSLKQTINAIKKKLTKWDKKNQSNRFSSHQAFLAATN